jgi:phosphatidylserine/phosphatidylglycerophosphate/cardiolipin synthase-like enzyme
MVYVNQQRAHRLWLVCPWIGAEEDARGALALLVDALGRRGCSTTLITRPPAATWHGDAVDALRRQAGAVVYVCPNLHTKLYVVECDGFRGAVLGSANFTPRADRFNHEIAVEFRTTREGPDDEVAAIVTELINYASSLREHEDVSLL